MLQSFDSRCSEQTGVGSRTCRIRLNEELAPRVPCPSPQGRRSWSRSLMPTSSPGRSSRSSGSILAAWTSRPSSASYSMDLDLAGPGGGRGRRPWTELFAASSTGTSRRDSTIGCPPGPGPRRLLRGLPAPDSARRDAERARLDGRRGRSSEHQTQPGGDAEPVPVAPMEAAWDGRANRRAGAGVRVAIADTAVAGRPQLWGHVLAAGDALLPSRTDDILAEAGHGTFVTGPRGPGGARGDRARGTGARRSVTRTQRFLCDRQLGRRQASGSAGARPCAQVINLSLGCHTGDNKPPLVFARALERLGPDVVVVAAPATSLPTSRSVLSGPRLWTASSPWERPTQEGERAGYSPDPERRLGGCPGTRAPRCQRLPRREGDHGQGREGRPEHQEVRGLRTLERDFLRGGARERTHRFAHATRPRQLSAGVGGPDRGGRPRRTPP